MTTKGRVPPASPLLTLQPAEPVGDRRKLALACLWKPLGEAEPLSVLGTDPSCPQTPIRVDALNDEALGFGLYPLLGEAA